MHDPVRFAKRRKHEQARAETETARWREEHANFIGHKHKIEDDDEENGEEDEKEYDEEEDEDGGLQCGQTN